MASLVYWFISKYFIIKIIYITCVSGVVYDIIHDVPFVVRDNDGNIQLFSGGVKYNYYKE
jgi:hypothetical protein